MIVVWAVVSDSTPTKTTTALCASNHRRLTDQSTTLSSQSRMGVSVGIASETGRNTSRGEHDASLPAM